MIANQNRGQEKLTKAIDALSKNSNKNALAQKQTAEATIRGNKEAEKRNGHLAELVLQNSKQMEVVAGQATKKIMNAFQNVNEQVVEHQHIKATENE